MRMQERCAGCARAGLHGLADRVYVAKIVRAPKFDEQVIAGVVKTVSGLLKMIRWLSHCIPPLKFVSNVAAQSWQDDGPVCSDVVG